VQLSQPLIKIPKFLGIFSRKKLKFDPKINLLKGNYTWIFISEKTKLCQTEKRKTGLGFKRRSIDFVPDNKKPGIYNFVGF